MLVRLLIALLTLTGPLPVRICTCAAGAPPCLPVAGPVTPAPTRCGCHAEKAGADAGSQPAVGTETGDAHSHPVRHDQDCPAVNPVPAQSAAVSTATPDVPVDADPGISPRVEPSDVRTARAASGSAPRPVVGTVPLYISLLSIRV